MGCNFVRNLLILGAGIYQVPVIEKAKELGFRTVVVSYNIQNYPGSAFADVALDVDTTDSDRVLAVAKEYNVSGVFTSGTDVAIASLGKVNSALNLCGPNYEAALLSTNKLAMKNTFINEGVPTAKFFPVFTFNEASDVAEKIGFPVVIKVINNSGSRGVSSAENLKGLREVWEFACCYRKDGDPILVEEYLDGVEFGAQAFIYNGVVRLICPHNDTVTSFPCRIPIGHSYPFAFDELNAEIEDVVNRGIKSLKIDNSAANIDFICTSSGVKILEIGARMGATCLDKLTSIFTGIDIMAECIKMSTGQQPNFTPKTVQPVAGFLLGSPRSGYISTIHISDTVWKDKNLVRILIDAKSGQEVNKFKIGSDRIGEIVAIGNDYIDAENNLKRLREQIKIDVSQYKKVPFNVPTCIGNEQKYISQVFQNTRFSGDGDFTKKCHQFLETNFGVKKALLTTSCTHALDMMALLLDLKDGDEVILPSYTFTSAATSICLRNAKPVFVDIDEDTLNIDAQLIEVKITSCTKAISVMHYAGIGCDMDLINKLAKKYNLYVLEDAAHGIGSKYKGKYLGTLGTFGAYSFHETKNITCGEGGALLINNDKFIERAEILREKGTNRSKFYRGEIEKYSWVDIGSSFLPSEILAAFLFAQLEQFEKINKKRLELFDSYNKGLLHLVDKELLRVPMIPNDCLANGNIFYILLDNTKVRDALMSYLRKRNIHSYYHYVPLHLSVMGKRLGYKTGQLPVTERVSSCLLRLPLYYDMSEELQNRVINSISSFFAN